MPPDLERRVATLPLTTRTICALVCDGIETVAGLAPLSDAELLRIPNIGKLSVRQIRGALTQLGVAQDGHQQYGINLDMGTVRVTLELPEVIACVVTAIEGLCRERAARTLLEANAGTREERDAAIWAAWRSGGVTQREIGRRYGITTSAVNIVIHRFWEAEILPTLTPAQQHSAETRGHDHRLGMPWYNGG